MKKFTINCDFGGQMAPFTIFIGKPEKGRHPLHFQADWLSKSRGGMIPGKVMEAISELQDLANKNGVLLEELCVYALGSGEQEEKIESEESMGSNLYDENSQSECEYDEEHVEDQNQERHDFGDYHDHSRSESAEDMASEGGHIEEDTPEEIELYKKSSKKS